MLTFVFDTETTGLIKSRLVPLERQPQVIELFGQLVDDKGETIEEIEFLANPGKKLEPIITKITGLTDDDLKDASPFSDHAEKVQELMAKADCVVAHNLTFDIGMVDLEFKRLEKEFAWPSRRVCTVEATEHLKGRRLKLGELHEFLFEEKFEGAHRARVDVAALTRCFNELRNRKII